VHALVAGRKTRHRGVTIPFGQGLAGPLGCDVLLHAICDALIGAAGSATSAGIFPTRIRATRAPTAAGLLRRSGGLLEAGGCGW